MINYIIVYVRDRSPEVGGGGDLGPTRGGGAGGGQGRFICFMDVDADVER